MELMKGYKQTEIGAYPIDWTIQEINSLGTINGRVGWKGYTKKDLRDYGPYAIGAKHIDNQNRLDLSEPTHLAYEKFIESPEIMVQRDDILIVQRGTIGKVVHIENEIGDATINPSMLILRLAEVLPKYAFLYLTSNSGQKQILEDTSSTGVPMITQKQVLNFKLPLPPTKAEQTAIANALSDMDQLIAGLEQLIAKKKAIKQGAMQELLRPKEGWVVRKLGEVVSKITVGFVGSMSHLFLESGIPVLRGLNILPGKIDLSVVKYISTSTHKEWSKSALREGDVVIVRVGYPGTAAVVPRGFPEANAASLVIVSPNEKLLCSDFLAIYLNSNLGVKQIQEKLVGGAQQVFNIGTAADLEIPIPSLIEEQINIADCINAFDDEIDLLTKNLSKHKLLKQGMMQELLTGKTRLV